MRTLLTRALAGTAIAAAVVLTASGTASAVVRQVSAPTTLSITETKAIIKLGQVDTLGGMLRSGATPLAGQVVILDQLIKGKPVFVDARFTDASGDVSYKVAPSKTTLYQLVFEGSPGFAGTRSGIATVAVLRPTFKKPTVLSIGDTRAAIHHGQLDIVFGGLISGQTPLAGQLVWLYEVVKGQLVNGDGHFTNQTGVAYFTVAPGATTHYELKFFGTRKYGSSHSAELTVLVR
jgi:hypothetical protein